MVTALSHQSLCQADKTTSNTTTTTSFSFFGITKEHKKIASNKKGMKRILLLQQSH